MQDDNKNLSQYKKYLYKIAITLIVVISLIFIINEINRNYKLLELPLTFEPSYLIYCLIVQIIFIYITTFAWKFNIFLCSNKSIPLISSFSQISLVFVGKYLPGKIWGMYARSLNLLSHNITYRESILGSYIEQLISVHSGLSLGALSVLLALNSPLVLPLILLITLSIYFAPNIQNILFRFISKHRKKMNEDEIEIESFELKRSSYFYLFLLYLSEWLFMGFILVILYFALYDTSQPLTFVFLLIGSSSIAFVAGFFSFFAPGGIGVREGVIVSLLSQHIPITESLILVIAFRLWCTCSDIIVGVLGLLLSDKISTGNNK